jgi:multidrug resistance efflux pump
MLNISKNRLLHHIDLNDYQSGKKVLQRKHYKFFNRFLTGAAIGLIVFMFLPWTQNVKGNGFVTTLTPDQRPQTLQSAIPGRIEQWLVREGDYVSKGDTLLRISEVKNEYFDPQLVERTGQQIDAKSASVVSYTEKVRALDQRIAALGQERRLKLEQARNKLEQAKFKAKSDSIDLVAAITNLGIAKTRLDREQALLDEGISAPKDLEEKRLKFQETVAKRISQENKLLGSRNQIIVAQIDLDRIEQEYAEKIAKANSEKFTAQSSQFETEAQVSKLQTDRTNYTMRNNLYYITAPQNGYINKAIKGGIGETFKEGEPLVNIMPADYDLAVETFVEPLDLPLIHLGEKVRVQFDGWPAIVFSGWPNVSYGTYGATVVAVETFTNDNGKYRVLLAPDVTDHPWPTALRPGSGAYTIALLEDVPIWYELWRHLNGFPPNYYTPSKDTAKKKDKKK